MQRRDFLALSGATMAVTGMGLPRFSVGGISRIGIQLYSVRDLFGADPERTLAALAAIGYQEVETAGYAKATPAEMKAMLGRTGLVAPSAHVDLDALTTNLAATLDATHTVGHQYLMLAWIGAEQRKSLDTYRKVADVLNRAASEAKAAGIQIGYHNHDFEFAPLEGKTGYEALLESADHSLVKFELDLYWATKAGADPLKLFAAWPERFPAVHVKDMGPNQSMVDVGDGTIDFARIFTHARQAGIRHYFVEHDEPKDAMLFARKSHDHLAKLTFEEAP